MLTEKTPDVFINHNDIIKRSSEVMDYLKKVIKQNPPFDMNKRLERQAKLVILDKQFFPKEIIETFEKQKEVELSKPRVNYSSLNMYNLLEGTRYVKERKSENEAPIFKDFDNMLKNSLF
jgi:hypothetical protein